MQRFAARLLWIPLATVPLAWAQPTTAPSADAQERAERMIREVYREQYASHPSSERIRLAGELLEQALQTRDDPAARFVLLREARDLAAHAGEAKLATRAVRLLCDTDVTSCCKMLRETMQAAAPAATQPAQQVAITQCCLETVPPAIGADDLTTAEKLVTLANASAEKSGQIWAISAAREARDEVNQIAAMRRLSLQAQQTLQENDEDPAANLAVGQYLGLYRGHWDAALAHLAKAGDAPMSELARRELSPQPDLPTRLLLADEWWKLAQNERGIAQRNLRHQAGVHYRASIDQLSGLHAALAEKRLAEIEQDELAMANLRPGLQAELFKGIDFTARQRTRIDRQIDFDWGEDAADEALPKDNFSIRWTGLLRPAAPGTYDLLVIANNGVRIWIDEKLVFDAPNLSHNRNGQRVALQLERPTPIRVDFWDTSGLAKMKLYWRTPRGSEDVPVPATALLHEAGADD